MNCIRKNAIHKATTGVAKTKRPEVVVLEMMLADEQKANQEAEQAIRAADKAREKRDQYCLEMEKQYNVSMLHYIVEP